jgi:hypothetical protein
MAEMGWWALRARDLRGCAAVFARPLEKTGDQEMSGSQTEDIAPNLFECLLERAAADFFAEMGESQGEEIAPQLFECFIDRAEAHLPEFFHEWAKGALIAGPGLIRSLADYSGSYESWGWERSVGAAFRRPSKTNYGELNITKGGEFWYIYRENDLTCITQALVVAFEDVPICTRTFRDAIRLAEHCHPIARAPMPGYWLNLRY